ncbi:hypothetical protein GCM10010442_26510 [Kitasatospora kifunensis]
MRWKAAGSFGAAGPLTAAWLSAGRLEEPSVLEAPSVSGLGSVMLTWGPPV